MIEMASMPLSCAVSRLAGSAYNLPSDWNLAGGKAVLAMGKGIVR